MLKKVVADNLKRKSVLKPASSDPYTPGTPGKGKQPASSDMGERIKEEMLAFFQAAKPPKDTPADVDMPAKMKELGLDELYPSECWPNMAAVRSFCRLRPQGLHKLTHAGA